jgi:MOSC domain-containing protein YiiM
MFLNTPIQTKWRIRENPPYGVYAAVLVAGLVRPGDEIVLED